MTNARLVLTTVGLKDTAEKLATQLVERRLAACVNRWPHPVQSIAGSRKCRTSRSFCC